MKSSLIVIAAVISLVKGSAAVDVAHVALALHQRVILESKSPAPVDARFSFDAPAGPQFTNAEKETQRERGRQVLPMVKKAFDSGAREVRIPSGDYRKGPK